MFLFIRSIAFAFAHTLILVGFVGMIVALIAEGKALLFHLIESIFKFGFLAKPPKEPPDKRSCNSAPSCWTRLIVTNVGDSYLIGSTQTDSALENQVRAQDFEIDFWPIARGSFASKDIAKAHSHSFGCVLIHSFASLNSLMHSTTEPHGSRFHLNCDFDHEKRADSSFSNLLVHLPVGTPASPRPFEGGQSPEPSRRNDWIRFDTKSAFEFYDFFIAGSSRRTIQDTFAADDTKVFDSPQITADWLSSCTMIFEIVNDIALQLPDLTVTVFEIPKLRLLVLIAGHCKFEEPGTKHDLIVALFVHFN